MKEAKDLTPIEWVIYYWNNCLAFILCSILIWFNWQIGIVMVLSGYFIFKMLWFSRKSIYQLGVSRFYFLGIGLYISFLFSIFITLDNNYYALTKLTTELNGMDSYLTYLINNLPLLLHWKHMLFGFGIGVLMYIINVELSRKNIKERDLMGIQVDKKELYNINVTIHVLFLSILCVALFFVSWVNLVLVIALELILCSLNRVGRRITLCVSIIIVLLFSVYINAQVLYLPHYFYKYMIINGFIAFSKLQILNMGIIFYKSITYCLLPYIVINLIFELYCSSRVVNMINEQNADKILNIKYKNGDLMLGTNLVDGNSIKLTDEELNQHMFVMGTTGAGKTVAILNMVLHSAKKGYPLIFLDGKGQVDLIERLAKLSQDYGRVFRVFTLRPEAVSPEYQKYVASYNPFAAGTFTEWKNRILSLFAEVKGKGQQHFALLEEDLINTVSQVLFNACKTVDLEFLYHALSNVDFIIELAQKNGNDMLAHKLQNMDKELVKDVAIMLGLFVESSYGKLFETDGSNNVISIRSGIENNEIILFLLDSSAYKSDTEKIAKLIINDINSSFSELVKAKTSYCVFDEFASYACSNLSDTISLMRSKGMHAIIGTQSVVSISLKSEETRRVAEELKSCCNTYLCLAINNEQDAEIMGKVYNTKDDFEVTTQIDVSIGGATGMGSSKAIKVFNVNPEQFKNLSVGEGFLYRKVAKLKPVKIKVNSTGY
jgi:conjugal transfer pilus assembly protein TraD